MNKEELVRELDAAKRRVRELESQLSDGILPEMAANEVLNRCGIMGIRLSVVLKDQAAFAQRDGIDLMEWIDRAVDAFHKYQEAKPKLTYTKGLERFFGEGDYKNPDGWPWKTPIVHRKYLK